MNYLYYGDNLDVLRRHIKDETVDLVYLDPPFNSNQDYNVLYAEHNGTGSTAQIKAFEDTWHWDRAAAQTYQETVEAGGKVALALRAFRTFLGDSDMLAYLSMMAPRLVGLRRVLKPTASIYLHCDPTASHYLKMLMDAVFGPANFRNEIIWRRTNARSTSGRWPRLHDVLLVYSKTDTFKFRPTKARGAPDKLPHTLITGPDGFKYQTYELTAPGRTKNGESGQPWRGYDPSAMGRHWANNREQMEVWHAAGQMHWPKDSGFPRRRAQEPFDATTREVMVGDVWTDIDRINQTAKERLGYPTQKPEALLERIISASSDEGDTVLDPFCGCGTAVAVAQRLGRQWVGIDITFEAIRLIKTRLQAAFGDAAVSGDTATFKTIGEPTTESEAETLARQDPFQFQTWALGLVGARSTEFPKGADRGIDGRLHFHEDLGGDTKQIVFSVKAGQLKAPFVRELNGVLNREDAEIGVLISLAEPTRDMRKEAASAGFYVTDWGNHPRLQLLTVGELLGGKKVDMPPERHVNVTFKKAPKAKSKAAEQIPMGLEEPDTES